MEREKSLSGNGRVGGDEYGTQQKKKVKGGKNRRKGGGFRFRRWKLSRIQGVKKKHLLGDEGSVGRVDKTKGTFHGEKGGGLAARRTRLKEKKGVRMREQSLLLHRENDVKRRSQLGKLMPKPKPEKRGNPER